MRPDRNESCDLWATPGGEMLYCDRSQDLRLDSIGYYAAALGIDCGEANHSPDAFTRHLRAAHGYLELGHVAQARDHLPKPAFLPKPSDGILRGLLHGAWA